MNQEVSISFRAVKIKVTKLIDAFVKGEKTKTDVQECIGRWWSSVHPSDRAAAQKYLLTVLERHNASLIAITDGLSACRQFAIMREPASTPSRITLTPRNVHQSDFQVAVAKLSH